MKKLIALFLLVAGAPAFADLDITVTSGATAPTPIAVVPFAQPADVSVDLAQIIGADLDRSGIFKTLPRTDMLEKPTDVAQVNFRNWQTLGQQDLVIGTVTRVGGGIAASFRLLDVYHSDDPAHVLLLGKDGISASDPARYRLLAHQIADLIYERLTGVRGYFSTQFAYVTAVGSKDSRRYQVIVADADGEGPHAIATSRDPLMSPTWSPDGKRIAYVGYDRSGNSAIYVQTPATGDLKKFVGERGINGSPSFSPDGRQLAVTLSFEHNPDIYVIDMATSARRRLTTDSSIDTEASWSPDGRTIAFISDRGGSPQIYTVSASGGEQKRLTFQGKRNEKPVYSPDGKSMALVNLDSSSYRIALLDLASGTLKTLSDGPLDESPSFAPNGVAVIYTKQGRQGSELAMVSLDGRIKQSLRQPGDVREPAWSPYLQ
ncbi:MAG: tolB [Nevskia sp.]|nr:tolB [Nevskia sp.]